MNSSSDWKAGDELITKEGTVLRVVFKEYVEHPRVKRDKSSFKATDGVTYITAQFQLFSEYKQSRWWA